jgi:undecaprenyl-diphosphatase
MRRFWARLLVFVLAVATSEASIGLLKAAYDRPRPPGSLVSTSGASFPSGHAIAVAATVIALVIVVFPPGKERRHWEYMAGTFAFLMALSRTYLRAHWLSDVVAGTLLGLAFAVGCAAIVQAVTRRRERRARAPAASSVSPATPGT